MCRNFRRRKFTFIWIFLGNLTPSQIISLFFLGFFFFAKCFIFSTIPKDRISSRPSVSFANHLGWVAEPNHWAWLTEGFRVSVFFTSIPSKPNYTVCEVMLILSSLILLTGANRYNLCIFISTASQLFWNYLHLLSSSIFLDLFNKQNSLFHLTLFITFLISVSYSK